MSIALAVLVNVKEPPLTTLCVVALPLRVPNVIVWLPTESCLSIIVPYSPFLTLVKLIVVLAVKVVV
jgi:hypothetical protein